MKKFFSLIRQRFSRKIISETSLDRINEERKLKHVLFTLAFTALGSLLFIPVHLFFAQVPLAGFFNFLCLILVALTLVDLWYRRNLRQSLLMSVFLPSALVISVFWALQGDYQIGAYLIIPPGFAFLLLGYRNGILYSLAYAAVIIALVLFNHQAWPTLNHNIAAPLNLVGAVILALFWGCTAEFIRGDTLEAIEVITEGDTLTSAVNRRHFFEEMQKMRKVTRYQGASFVMMMMDIDGFKSINDEYGHDAGDKALIDLARLLNALIRKNDIVGRLGGDEFGLLFPHMTEQEAVERAEHIRSAVERHAFKTPDKKPLSLTVSIGVTVTEPKSFLSTKQIYKSADLQLYNAKQKGKNRISVGYDIEE